MTDYTWQDNTKEIYEKAIAIPPAPFRKLTRKSIDEALAKKVGDSGIITEQCLVECIKEVTPKPFVAMGMKQLKPLLKNEY